jgi:hypothetical protein
VSEARKEKRRKKKKKRGNPTQHESAFATGDFGGWICRMYVGRRNLETSNGTT